MFTASSILGNDFRAMSVALDGLTMRQHAHSQNLANVDTPGYQARTVEFERSLKAAIDSGAGARGRSLPMLADGGRLPGAIDGGLTGGLLAGTGGSGASPHLKMTTTGGEVNRITETTGMLETMIRYRVITQQVTNKISGLRNVLSEMGRA